MTHHDLWGLAGLAAMSRIEELTRERRMKAVTRHARTETDTTTPGDETFKRAVRRMWALGDYHTFANRTVWTLGRILVEACRIQPGQRVLDVAAGTGNTAIRAAELGAQVVASDLTPENFAAGRREAARHGVELEWVEGDAESLPFEDGEFDVVTSSVGAIFAPDHRAVANEMLRVCRPGGTIGMINFRPVSLAADFFSMLARYLPPLPAGALPPLLWGEESHVQQLFGGRVASLEMTRGQYVEHSPAGPAGYLDLFLTTFGPVIAARASIADDPERTAAFDREFQVFVTENNHGSGDGPAAYPYEYLLVVAHRSA